MLGPSQRKKKSLIYFASGLRLNGVDIPGRNCIPAINAPRFRAGVYSSVPDSMRAAWWAQAPLGDATKGSRRGLRHVYRRAPPWRRCRTSSAPQDTSLGAGRQTLGGKGFASTITYLTCRASFKRKRLISSYYILGYYTRQSDQALNGKFRKI